ncbi:hypothetical protein E8E13_011257 [Curvularia kusanoi]|uniref:Uncharacterized protein n=1 Tax=Curvularia kusanoi TaxID=90978 RepID=A0A9P4TJ37_CURKU|nr:hypothetical protein E8E13_011257 [Curvularia kusanoi]
MPKVARQDPKLDIKSYHPYRRSYNHTNASMAGFQVLQYRSYQRDVFIYHIRTDLLPLPMVRRALQTQKEYRDKLTGFDPIRSILVVEGDEVPPGSIEAAYMPGVGLRGQGSALGIRSDQESGKVEWLIFNRAIHEDFLNQIVCTDGHWSLLPNVDSGDSSKVFDLVGYAEKGLATRTVRGANREHRGWHDSLCNAKEGKARLILTWKGYLRDLKADQEWRRRSRTIESDDTAE